MIGFDVTAIWGDWWKIEVVPSERVCYKKDYLFVSAQLYKIEHIHYKRQKHIKNKIKVP